MLKLDKEKYFRILKAEGLSAAITALHRDKDKWEYVTFEGDKGYQRQMWDDLEAVRQFSLELWDIGTAGKDPHPVVKS